MPNVQTTAPKPGAIRIVAFASFVGTTIEWYDFFLYGTAAALVFNRLFFPTFDPLAGTLAAFGTYAVGFIARPIGGVVIGHFGDRIGRKSMLVLTLMIMGIATFLIGLLPTYDRIGWWAALLLVVLRLAQGFGVGGEWGGAALMAVEHAPAEARGFYGSWPQIGVPVGLLLSTAVYVPLTRLPQEAFLSWGWRVPFLLSLLLVVVGLVIRLRILETPAFAALKEQRHEARTPVVEVLRRYPRQVLLVIGARVAENGAFYLYSVFALTYATAHVHMDRNVVLECIMLAAAIEIGLIPVFGALSDRVGRRPVFLFGAVGTAICAYPIFWLFDSGSRLLVWVAMMMGFTCHAAMYAPQSAFFSELFGTRVRYSGASLGTQLASVLAGGLSPFIATALLRRGYGRGALALYLIGLASITIVSVFLASETRETDIHDLQTQSL